MGTVRIGGIVKSGPSTQFWLEADWVRADWGGNYTVLGVWLRAANGPGGNSSSYFGNWGKQTAHANGYLAEHNGQPFLPSGYAQNQTRWHDYYERAFGHDGEGWGPGVGLAMELVYGGVNEIHYGSIGAPGRIPKPPTAPQNLRVESVTPTSAGVRYNGSADYRGASVSGWTADWYEINNANNPLVWRDLNSNGYTSPQGGAVPGAPALKPGTTYHVYIYARSNVGDGASASIALTTLPSSAPGMAVVPAASGASARAILSPPGGISGVTKYRVEYEKIGVTGTTVVENAGSPVTITNLTPGQKYRYRGSAFIGTYQSPWTPWVTVQQPDPNSTLGGYFDGDTTDTAEVIYSWDGTAGSSTSAATGQSPQGWDVAAVGGRAVIQRVIGGRSGQYGARVTVQQAASLIRAGQKGTADGWTDVEGGATYYGGVYVAAPVALSLTPEITWYTDAGVLISRVTGAPVAVPAGSAYDTRLEIAATAPANAEHAIVSALLSNAVAGTAFFMDDSSVFLSAQYPFFSGATPDTVNYRYDWLGDANASTSSRTTLDVSEIDPLADPDCPPPPAPPRAPSISDPCIEEVGTWRRYWAVLNAGQITRWLDVIPTFRLTTQGEAARQVRIRIFPNPDNIAPGNFDDPDGWVSEQIVSYLPPYSVMRIDGVSERVRASVNGGDWLAADHLLFGTAGGPAAWPVLDCGIPYLVAFDAPLDAAAGNLSLDVEITRRH